MITGSRIAAPNMTSTSPVQVVYGRRRSSISARPTWWTSWITLPQVFQNSAIDFSNTSNSLSTPGGLTTVNLRGLGVQRTLVLVDGRGSARRTPTPAIPNPAPESGPDPGGVDRARRRRHGRRFRGLRLGRDRGVVNFIMRKTSKACRSTRSTASTSMRTTTGSCRGWPTTRARASPTAVGPMARTSACRSSAGTNIADGRGNFTAYLTYREADPITGSDRDFAGCQLFTVLPDSSVCGGSSNSNFFRLGHEPDPYTRGRRSIPAVAAGRLFAAGVVQLERLRQHVA